MSKSKLQPEKISILDIRIIKGEIDSPHEVDLDKIEGYSFDLDYSVGFNSEENLAKADIKVEVETESSGNYDEAYSFFHISYLFEVENMEELATPLEKPDEIEVDGALNNALASITYSTTRGILLTRYQGTAFASFKLPVINPNDLLKE